MRLTHLKSFEISKDIGEFIARVELDSVEAAKTIEVYRRERGVDACGDVPEVCRYLLEKLEPAQPSLIESTGSTIKVTLFEKIVPRVVITLDGGLVQDMHSDLPMDALILDYDIGNSDDELSTINGQECYANIWNPYIRGKTVSVVEEIFKELDAQSKNA